MLFLSCAFDKYVKQALHLISILSKDKAKYCTQLCAIIRMYPFGMD